MSKQQEKNPLLAAATLYKDTASSPQSNPLLGAATLYSDTFPSKKKEDTVSSGQEDSTDGLSKPKKEDKSWLSSIADYFATAQPIHSGGLGGAATFRDLSKETGSAWLGKYDKDQNISVDKKQLDVRSAVDKVVTDNLLNSDINTSALSFFAEKTGTKPILQSLVSGAEMLGAEAANVLGLLTDAIKKGQIGNTGGTQYGITTSSSTTSSYDPKSVKSSEGLSGALYEAGQTLQGVSNSFIRNAKEGYGIKNEDVDKSFTQLLSEGKTADAFTSLALTGVQQIPQQLALVTTGGSAAGVFLGSMALGTGAAVGEEYAKDKEISGGDALITLAKGMVEGVTESVFRSDINALNSLKGIINKEGKEATKEAVVRGMSQVYKKAFAGANEEGVEEILANVGDFIIEGVAHDKFNVTEYNKLLQSSIDSFVLGASSGGMISGPVAFATLTPLTASQKKQIERYKEVAQNESFTQDIRDAAIAKIQEIKDNDAGKTYDNYQKIAGIEDVNKRAEAIRALEDIKTEQASQKELHDESLIEESNKIIEGKKSLIDGILGEQYKKEYERSSQALKDQMKAAKVTADEFLQTSNSYAAFQEDHSFTLEDIKNNKPVEVSVLNDATDQLHEVGNEVHNSDNLTAIEKDAILSRLDKQIRQLEGYANATEKGQPLQEAEVEGRRMSTKARAVERAQRIRNNRFQGQQLTAFDEKGNPFQVTAQVNERGQISFVPKPKYRFDTQTKEAIQVDNSIKIKGDLEVIDKVENEDGDITKIKVKDIKTGRVFETNSPVLIPYLTSNRNIRQGSYQANAAYQVDENIEHIESHPVVNKLTKEQKARIKNYYLALKEINPEANMVIFDNEIELANELMRRGAGRNTALKLAKGSKGLTFDNEVFVNRRVMSDTTLPHEIFHQAFRGIAVTEPQMFIDMMNKIMMVLPENTISELKEFASLYAKDVANATDKEKLDMAEEFLVQLGGLLTTGDTKIQRGFIHDVMLAIREFLQKYARKFKMNALADLIDNKVFFESASIEELAQFFEGLSKSIRTGEKADMGYVEKALTPEQEQEDIDNLTRDEDGELFEPQPLNITGTISEPTPSTGRKPRIKSEKISRGDIEVLPHKTVAKDMLVGKSYSVTMSDHTKVGEYVNEKTGVHVKNLMGGIFYPYIKGIRDAGLGWASVTIKAAREMVVNAHNLDYTVIYRMARATGSRGNHNFNEVAFAELTAPVKNGKISEVAFLKALNNKLNSVSGGTQLGAGKSILSKAGKDSGKTITIHKTETIDTVDKNGKPTKKTVKVLDSEGNPISIKAPRLEITSIKSLEDALKKQSFGTRGSFWSTIMKDSWSKKSSGEWYPLLEKLNVASLEDIVNGLAEHETDTANDHDIVAVLKLAAPELDANGKVKIYTTRQGLVDEKNGVYFIDAPDHPSYPYVVKGEPVGVLDEFNHIGDYFPIVNEKMEKNKKIKSPYKLVETQGKELAKSTIKSQKDIQKLTDDYNKIKDTLFGGLPINANRAFFTDLNNSVKLRNDPRADIVAMFDKASMWLNESSDGYITIEDFQVSQDALGTGKGKEALSTLIKYANENNITLLADIVAQETRRGETKKGLSQKELVAFYKRNGFTKISEKSLDDNRYAEEYYYEKRPQQIKSQKQTPAGKVANIIANQVAAAERMKKVTWKQAYRWLYKQSFDRMVNVRKEMEDSEFNRSMFLMYNRAGASQFGNQKFEQQYIKIYKGLNAEEKQALDAMILAERTIAIDTNFDNQRKVIQDKIDEINQKIADDPTVREEYADELRKLKSDLKSKARPAHGRNDSFIVNGVSKPASKETAIEALAYAKQVLGDEKYNDLQDRTKKYFKAFSDILQYKYNNGIITEETYNLYKDYNYSPRKFLNHIFGIEEFDKDGKPTGTVLLKENQFSMRGSLLSSDDIKNIQNGSDISYLMTDSAKLLQSAMIMAEMKVATNKMSKALAEESQHTNQEWVKPLEYERYNDGTIKTNPDGSYKYSPTQDGYRRIDYWIDGKKYSFQMYEHLAKEFYDEELKGLKAGGGYWYRLASKLGGGSTLKLFATGINSGFFISNIPVDVINQVQNNDIYQGGIAGKYKEAIEGTLDISKRLLEMKAGKTDVEIEQLLQEYAESGGLMMTQTQQGFEQSVGKDIRNKIAEYLGMFGNVSEIASKLNSYRTVRDNLVEKHYQKTKQNATGDTYDAIKEEAAYRARAAMDYHRGGIAAKMWDDFVPYFNVFAQGNFIIAKYLKNNPTKAGFDLVKAGIALAGLTVYNMMVAGDDYDNDDIQLDLLNKIVLFSPFKNADGTRNYIKIALPSMNKAFLNVFQHIGEASYYKLMANEPTRQQKWRSEVYGKLLDGFRPSLSSFVGVPVVKAGLEYHFGEDLYRNIPIFMEGTKPVSSGHEGYNDEKVLELFKLLGKVGISPIKGQKALEDFITPYNPAVQMGYHVVDKTIDTINFSLNNPMELKDFQRSKYGKADMATVATSFFSGIKNRAVDVSDPSKKYATNKEEYQAIDEERGDVYYDIKASIKDLVKKGGNTKQFIESVEGYDMAEKKMARSYYMMLKRKSELKSPNDIGNYTEIMFSTDAKAKAKKLLIEYKGINIMNPKNKSEADIKSDLIRVKAIDPETMYEYRKLLKEQQ